MADEGIWTADELMHGKYGGGGAPESPSKEAPASASIGGSVFKRASIRKLKGSKGKPTDPMDWGMPGHLTEEEVATFVSFCLVSKACMFSILCVSSHV